MVPIRNFFKPIIVVTEIWFNVFLPQQIEPVALAHMEDNSDEVDSTTTIEQGRSSKPRSGKPRVKFQAPVKQKRKNTENIIEGGKKQKHKVKPEDFRSGGCGSSSNKKKLKESSNKCEAKQDITTTQKKIK